MSTNFYTYINTFDSYSIFLYSSIGIITLAIFNYTSVKLNIILGLFIAYIIILYLSEKRELGLETEHKQHETKIETIKPNGKRFDNYNDFTDFFFSIQDIYVYNPLAYEEMIDSVSDFLDLYEDMKRAPSLSNTTYSIAEKKKSYALNSLGSIIIQSINSKLMILKIQKALDVLETILNKYMQEMYDIHQYNLLNYGYDSSYYVVNLGPKERNYYSYESYTYDIY